jgi:hypothetical protein
VSGSLGGEVSFRFDDEGYGKTTRVATNEFGLNFKLPFVKLNGKRVHAEGGYDYCRTARHHAICYFEELLRNNRQSPKINKFLSRRKTLGIQDSANEMEEFYAAQKDYLLQEKSAANAFSLFLSLDYSKNTIGYSKKGELIPSDQLKEIQSQAPLSAQITPNAKPIYEKEKKKAVVVSGTTETTTGVISGKAGLDAMIYEGSATLSGEWSSKVSKNTRYATAIDLLDNKYANSKQPFKEKLKSDVRASGAAIRERVCKQWYPKPKNKFVYDATACQLLALEYQRAPGDFAKHNLIRLVQEPVFNRIAPQALAGLIQDFDDNPTQYTRSQLIQLLGVPAFRERHRGVLSAWAYGYRENPDDYTEREIALLMQIPGIDEIAPGVGVRTDIDRLIQDYEFLEHLHAQRAMGDATVEKSIAQFYKMYGVKNTEECLRDMALLTAYFYEQLGDRKPAALATRLKELETRIYATGIPHRPDVLRKLAGASQNYYAITSEKTVQFALKNRLKLPFTHVTVPGLGFKANISDLKHYNPSRSGKSYNVEMTLSGDVGLDQEILSALAKLFKYEGASAMANYFETPDLAAKLGKGAFVVKYFLPEDPGAMQTVQLYKRLVTQTGFEITPELPIAIPGIANVTLSATYAGSNTQLALDMPTPETMILFILHYLHGIFTETIQLDKSDPRNLREVNNEDSQDSYWHVLLGHQATLEQLFLNIAQGKLANEFDHLERRYLVHASEEERASVAQAQDGLSVSAAKYRVRRTKENYQATLESFKAFMRSLYDPWVWTRELSDVYEPYQYEFNF